VGPLAPPSAGLGSLSPLPSVGSVKPSEGSPSKLDTGLLVELDGSWLPDGRLVGCSEFDGCFEFDGFSEDDGVSLEDGRSVGWSEDDGVLLTEGSSDGWSEDDGA
jgi:hypothetical protein